MFLLNWNSLRMKNKLLLEQIKEGGEGQDQAADELKFALDKNKKLQAKLEAQVDKAGLEGELQAQIESLGDENDTLKTELETQKVEAEKKGEERVAKLEAENKALTEQF